MERKLCALGSCVLLICIMHMDVGRAATCPSGTSSEECTESEERTTMTVFGGVVGLFVAVVTAVVSLGQKGFKGGIKGNAIGIWKKLGFGGIIGGAVGAVSGLVSVVGRVLRVLYVLLYGVWAACSGVIVSVVACVFHAVLDVCGGALNVLLAFGDVFSSSSRGVLVLFYGVKGHLFIISILLFIGHNSFVS